MFVHASSENTAVWIFGGTIGCVALWLGVRRFLVNQNGPVRQLCGVNPLPWIFPDVVTAMAWKPECCMGRWELLVRH